MLKKMTDITNEEAIQFLKDIRSSRFDASAFE